MGVEQPFVCGENNTGICDEVCIAIDAQLLRQLTGPCGESVLDAKHWTATYDISVRDRRPSRGGKVEMELLVCCPFGQYELTLDVTSYSDTEGKPEKRVAWRIENGYDGYIMWDTDDTDLSYDEDYCPKAPGVYTWPIKGETGYYKDLYAGPLPPVKCENKTPPDTEYVGCYSDSPSMRLFHEGKRVMKKGRDGMTNERCSEYCIDYDYFGTEYGQECYCGNKRELDVAESSDKCGTKPEYLCAGDASQSCGGRGALSVYRRKNAGAPHDRYDDDSAHRDHDHEDKRRGQDDIDHQGNPRISYKKEGCFVDTGRNRIMSKKTMGRPMSAEICFYTCNNGTYTHFGTQFGDECWCGEEPDLTANGDEVSSKQCHMECTGSRTGETCGAYDRMSVYKMTFGEEDSSYVGCYGDRKSRRAMPDAGKYTKRGKMTNEVCRSHCSKKGYKYAGTSYAEECWCSDSYDLYGPKDKCDYCCEGNERQKCGGYNALSVYKV